MDRIHQYLMHPAIAAYQRTDGNNSEIKPHRYPVSGKRSNGNGLQNDLQSTECGQWAGVGFDVARPQRSTMGMMP